jgi:hypothetical protein
MELVSLMAHIVGSQGRQASVDIARRLNHVGLVAGT